eukprot:gene409-1805_t
MNSIKCSPGAGISAPARYAAKPCAPRPKMIPRMPVRANAAALNYSASDPPRVLVSQGAQAPVAGGEYSAEQMDFMNRQKSERSASVAAGRVSTPGGPAASYTGPDGARLNYSPSDPPRAEVSQGAQAPVTGGQYSAEQQDFINRQRGERAASVAEGRVRPPPNAGYDAPAPASAAHSATTPSYSSPAPVAAAPAPGGARLNYSASDPPRVLVSQGAQAPIAGGQYSAEQMDFMNRQKGERSASVAAGRVSTPGGPAASYTGPDGARLNYSPSDPPRAELPQGAQAPVTGAQYSAEQQDFINRQKGERAASVAAGRIAFMGRMARERHERSGGKATPPPSNAPLSIAGLSPDQVAFMERMARERSERNAYA